MPVSILIADDNAHIRRIVRSCIEDNTDWEVCGEAGDGRAAVDLVRQCNPDIVILDLVMPVMNGLEAARAIAAFAPKTNVVLFTFHDSDELHRYARCTGIEAVVTKTSDHALQDLLTALREVVSKLLAA